MRISIPILILAPSLALIQTSTASAAGETWSIPSDYYVQPVIGPGGLVFDAPNSANIDVVHEQDGSPAWSVPVDVTDPGRARTANAVFDSSGELYLSYLSTGGQAIAEATGSGGMRWSQTLDAGCTPLGGEGALTLGFDGNVYALMSCGGPNWRIVALDAKTGAVVFDQVAPPNGTTLHAYHGGVIVSGGPQLSYLDDNGSLISSYTIPTINADDHQSLAAWGTDGSAYFLSNTGPFDPAITLNKYLPSGLTWTYTWPSAGPITSSNWPSIAALPNGSVAINMGLDGKSLDGVSLLDKSSSNPGAGVVKWSTNLGEDYLEFGGIQQVLGDDNNNVTAAFNFRDPHSSANCSYGGPENCLAYQLDLLDGSTGAIDSASDVHTNAVQGNGLYSQFDLDTDIAILGAPVGSQLTMFGLALSGAGPAYPEADRPAVSTNVSPLAITTTSLPGGRVGRTYGTTLAASGGTAPYTWKVVPGSTQLAPGSNQLPQGLSLDSSTGTISGRPSVAGITSVTLEVIDASGATRTASFTLVVDLATLVALGDSYSSGEGNPPFNATWNSFLCHRSAAAWPNYLADSQLSLTGSAACSGATLSALSNSYKFQPRQLAALGSQPDVVTITMGGDDVDFAPLFFDCVWRNCVNDGTVARTEAKIKGLGPSLDSAYASIKTADPLATVVVVGYPNLVPSPQTKVDPVCAAWLTGAERTALTRLAVEFDGVMSKAAADEQVQYVSILNALQGHELCTPNSWMNQVGSLPLTGDVHPNALGQQAIGTIVDAKVTALGF